MQAAWICICSLFSDKRAGFISSQVLSNQSPKSSPARTGFLVAEYLFWFGCTVMRHPGFVECVLPKKGLGLPSDFFRHCLDSVWTWAHFQVHWIKLLSSANRSNVTLQPATAHGQLKGPHQFSRPSDSGKWIYSRDALVCPLREGRLQAFTAYGQSGRKGQAICHININRYILKQ